VAARLPRRLCPAPFPRRFRIRGKGPSRSVLIFPPRAIVVFFSSFSSFPRTNAVVGTDRRAVRHRPLCAPIREGRAPASPCYIRLPLPEIAPSAPAFSISAFQPFLISSRPPTSPHLRLSLRLCAFALCVKFPSASTLSEIAPSAFSVSAFAYPSPAHLPSPDPQPAEQAAFFCHAPSRSPGASETPTGFGVRPRQRRFPAAPRPLVPP